MSQEAEGRSSVFGDETRIGVRMSVTIKNPSSRFERLDGFHNQIISRYGIRATNYVKRNLPERMNSLIQAAGQRYRLPIYALLTSHYSIPCDSPLIQSINL